MFIHDRYLSHNEFDILKIFKKRKEIIQPNE